MMEWTGGIWWNPVTFGDWNVMDHVRRHQLKRQDQCGDPHVETSPRESRDEAQETSDDRERSMNPPV